MDEEEAQNIAMKNAALQRMIMQEAEEQARRGMVSNETTEQAANQEDEE